MKDSVLASMSRANRGLCSRPAMRTLSYQCAVCKMLWSIKHNYILAMPTPALLLPRCLFYGTTKEDVQTDQGFGAKSLVRGALWEAPLLVRGAPKGWAFGSATHRLGQNQLSRPLPNSNDRAKIPSKINPPPTVVQRSQRGLLFLEGTVGMIYVVLKNVLAARWMNMMHGSLG